MLRLSRLRIPALFAGFLLLLSLVAMLADGPPRAADQPETRPAAALSQQLEPIRLTLDQLEAGAGREGLTDDMLVNLRDQVVPLRDDLRGKAAELEPRLTQIDGRIKELGAPPAKDAPPEDPKITREREELQASFAEIDAAIRQIRLLAVRADQTLERISEKRRQIFTREIFEHSPSILDPTFWTEVANTLPRELRSFGLIFSSWTGFALANGGLGGIVGTLVAVALAGFLLWRLRGVMQGWHNAMAVADTRLSKAMAGLRVMLFEALGLPVFFLAVGMVANGFGLIPERIAVVGWGLFLALFIATMMRGLSLGVLAPDAPDRRLLAIDDSAAQRLHRLATFGAVVFGLAIALNALHRMVVAPVALTIATSALAALAIAGLLVYALLRVRGADEEASGEPAPRAQWIRLLAWASVAVILGALVAGYIGFAAFIAGRVLTALAVLGALLLLLALVDAIFTEVLSSDAPKGRALAATLGLKPRSVELFGTLVAGVLRVALIVSALLMVLGPWGIFAADAVSAMQGMVFGFKVGEFTLSLAAIFGALAVLGIGLLATRGAQRWLETRFLPRTTLEPSLQMSVSKIIGYVGFILTITLALSELGINPQNIAILAGALSVGIGFGLQSIVSNFVSGLILLAERPIRVGDSIVVRGEEGYVRRISVRATEIETFERATVLVPNSELITGVVKNWTHSNTTGRVIVKVGTGYDVDTDEVRDLLIACACDHPQILQNPPPRVFLLGFGEQALQFELRCIVANVDYALSVRSDLHFSILRRFREAGIRIPHNAMTAPATPAVEEPPQEPAIVLKPARKKEG
jgi:small-conductance mechanosensitive channel